ncbi:MAG: phospholipase D-like domain-containing protein, partial [Candidatus Saccharimonas sp.]
MALPKIIDNGRKTLADTLNELAGSYTDLSIATGYWDLPGLLEIFDSIKYYRSIRLIIGQEPIAPRFAKQLNLNEPEETFPELDFRAGLGDLEQREEYRSLVLKTKELIARGALEVRVYRRNFLHAKTYIFGNYTSESAVGIIGSSNFTRAGLSVNSELNTLEDDYRIVKFMPQNDTDEYGHMSWFDMIWNDELNEEWTGKFTEILQDSPVGDLTFGPYDSYIKTLMEVFPDELIQKPELGSQIKDILYAFQNRNAGILINKLEKMGVAILSDSVGLGKTITAGAVVRHYIDQGAKRIIAIVPASLKEQ